MSKAVSTERLRMILGLKLKAARQEKELSLAQVASEAGMAVSYLSEIEKGKKYPKPDKLLGLARALDLSYDQLVSLDVDARLDPLAGLIDSEFVREFPFDLFGITPRDFLDLFSEAPERATAFLQTFLEITRAYDMSVENFLLAAMRTYQKLHRNYLPELEDEAQGFLDEQAALRPRATVDELARILVDRHGYRIDETGLADNPHLREFRSIVRRGRPTTLFVNPRLAPSQKAFVLAREIGFLRLGIDAQRPLTSTWVRVESFDELLHNYQASYFAGAVLLPRARLVPELGALLQQSRWRDETLLDMLGQFEVTPEMLLHRTSQLLPGVFGLDQLFYMRFTHDRENDRTRLTKELNLTGELVPYGLGLGEHYCRRWLPLQMLARSAADGAAAPRAGIQRARFIESGNAYVMLSLVRPMALSGHRHSAMNLGLKLDPESTSRIAFADDPALDTIDVGETCERCALTPDQCAERAAPATLYVEARAQRQKEQELERFLRDGD